MRERQMEELEHLKERSESINIPMLILFVNPSTEVEVVQGRGDQG